jgi:hypothetical protein
MVYEALRDNNIVDTATIFSAKKSLSNYTMSHSRRISSYLKTANLILHMVPPGPVYSEIYITTKSTYNLNINRNKSKIKKAGHQCQYTN